MAARSEREIWRAGETSCVMIEGCGVVELQVRRGEDILTRETYPSKSILYERAEALRATLNS